MRNRAICGLVATLLASTALAQTPTLGLDGEPYVQAVIGSNVTFSLDGTPGATAYIAVDIAPGPSFIFGQNVPIGATSAAFIGVATVLPAAGRFETTQPIPNLASLVGTSFYLIGAELDAMAPGGVAFSNGARLEFVSPATFTELELAGRGLATAPHFTPVRTFNFGTEIRVGVETSRHPFLFGKTANVYLVESKTTTEWTNDPGLADVSCDGADQVTFTSAGISANQLVVDDGCASPSNAVPLSKGYDIVIDVDRDGTLSAGDFIDGYDDTVAGCYVVADTTKPGPYPVIETNYGAGFAAQNLFYPVNIAELGQVPLVIVSHGNGHNFVWYDHIGNHLASWGYVVMSHANNTGPGVASAALTTLSNTDSFLGNLATIAGGVLNGHIDGSNIAWIGHSRGGEGVAIAYNSVLTGASTPANFVAADIKLISSIAPTSFVTNSQPNGVPYHLWVGSADSDVSGCPTIGTQVFPYALLTRAFAQKQSATLQGAGHDNFHNAPMGLSFGAGPNQQTRAVTHPIMLGYLLSLVDFHLRGDPAAKDFLTNEWQNKKPIGAPTASSAVVNLTYQEDPAGPDVQLIDDFQTQPSLNAASSGATVTFDVTGVNEGREVDGSDFSNSSEPFNGFNHAALSIIADNPRGVVFDYQGPTQFYRYDFTAPIDSTAFTHLSFRAAQAPRHPRTTAELAEITFEVRLEDTAGHQATISIGAYGGGVAEPYQRTGCGTGAGWHAEFETIRIPLPDFTNEGTMVDLATLQSLTFLFGSNHGSSQGRLGLDDVALIID